MQGGCRSLVLACLVVLSAATPVMGVEPPPAGVGNVELEHGLVHYELTASRIPCHGGRCPLVVLVAGYAVPMIVWDDTVPALAREGFQVLRFDLYGRGRSARPRTENYTPALFADQLWQLVTKLNLPNRFHVVASSMGGAVAAVFANRHPDAPDRVVLVSPAGLTVRFPYVTTLLKTPGLGKWYFDYRFRAIMLDHLQENLLRDVHRYPDVLAEFRSQLEVPGTADAMFWTLRKTVLQEFTSEFRGLGELRRPTLVIWGKEDRVVPLDKSLPTLERVIPHLTHDKKNPQHRIADAAHLPQLERPLEFNAAVTQFLRAKP